MPVTSRATLAKHSGHMTLGRLRFLRENGWLVGAGAPACRHCDVEQTQVNAELAAMLIPVTEHDIAQELGTRLHEDFAPTGNQAPCFVHVGVIEFWQQLANRGDT